jgi:GR25 family glycosyltransferase involved in LPS biosynthesis
MDKKINCYVINLDCQISEYSKFINVWDKYLNITRVSAIDSHNNDMNGKECCKKSHLDLMKISILNDKNDDPFIIIMEDDVYPTECFDKYWYKIINFINNLKNNYDFIHLDIILNLDIKNNSLEEHNNFLYEYKKGRNAGFMIYNKKFLTKFINSDAFDNHYMNLKQPLDYKQGLTFNINYKKLTCKELIVRQRTDKISTITNDRCYIQHYDEWYDKTNDYFLSKNKSLI